MEDEVVPEDMPALENASFYEDEVRHAVGNVRDREVPKRIFGKS